MTSEREAFLRGYAAGVAAALDELLKGEPEPAPKRRRPAATPTVSERKQGYHRPPANGRPPGTGSRQQAILDQLAALKLDDDQEPPTTVELADMMGSSEKYLYRALPVLLKQGKVRAHITSVDGETGILEPGVDVEGRRHLLGVMPRWSIA